MLLNNCETGQTERTLRAKPSAEMDLCVADYMETAEYPQCIERALIYYTFSCTE